MASVRVVQRFTPRSCRYSIKLSASGGHISQSAYPFSIGARHRSDQHDATSSFLSPSKAFAVKSNWELFRGWLVFKMFTYNSLVDNSEKLYRFSRRFLGYWLTEKLLRASVFGQFSGGLNETESETVVRNLAQNGVSSIWFFSDEKDIGEVKPAKTEEELEQQEDVYQKTNEKYLKSIEMSAACNCDTPSRFAAVKLTAIVNPTLLKRLNDMLLTSDDTFFSLVSSASEGSGKIDMNTMPPTLRKIPVPELLQTAGLKSKTMDLVDWRSFFSLPHNVSRFQLLPQLYSQVNGQLPELTLTDLEEKQLEHFIEKLRAIGECASSLGVRVLIDAEQNYFQNAIEHLVLHYMMKKFNHTHPLVYNTAQAYLTRVHNSILVHLTTTQRMGVQCGIKLVRGCYLEHETHFARNSGCISPLHPSKEATDESYNQALDHLLSHVQKGHLHLVVASHNRESIQRAVIKVKELGICPSDGSVTFGQQLGMGDHLSYPLAQAGFIVNKVLAYGSLDSILPFLIRRAQENRGFIRNAQEERFFYIDEIKQRLFS